MDDDSNSKLLEKIQQYQNSIIKHSEKGNDERILYYIKKLYDMPVTVEHLKQTGIGRTMNSLRKYSGDVGIASKAIVAKWKNMVSTEEEEAKMKSSPSPPAEDSDSPPDSPPPSPPPCEKPKIKYESKEEKYSRRDELRDKSSKRHDSSERSSKHKSEDRHSSKSHHRKEEKRNSHKSSHREKEHKSRHESDKHRKDDKYRHESKRKHEEERTPSKKIKYEANSSDSEDSNRLLVQDTLENLSDSPVPSDDNILPDSTTHHEYSRENTQSPVPLEVEEKIDHKKHHKSDKNDKHRSREKDRDKKELNGSHSSKKSSHKDKESKHESHESKHESHESKHESHESKHESHESKHESHESKHESQESKHESPKKEKSSSSKTSLKPTSLSKSPEKSKKVKIIHNDNGIDSGSGASFAEALGMIEPTKSSKSSFIKKKSSSASASPTPTPSTSTTKPSKPIPRPRTQSPLTQSPNLNLLSPNLKLEPLDTTIVSQLPEITTNYKPLGLNYDNSSPYGHVKHMSEEEALSVVISSKTQRTKVYSGVKTNWGFVPSLFQLCVRILQDNIDALEYTGGVPYEILKPVLERATANQLLNSEYYNPYLIEESDELWELHCKRECKGMKRQEMETWREMYLRIRDERDAKLKALTVNIKQSIDKSLPVRQTKLAYVDSVVKPPRGIARKQAKYGTSDNLRKPLITPTQRLNSIASGSGEKISVPNPGPRAVSSSASAIKPKKAPLMQKTLALMKGRFGRR